MIKANDIKDLLSSLFNSYADIFFIRSTPCGAILLAVTFLNYNAGLSGLLCVLSAYCVALLLGYQAEFLRTGYFTYNALLVGLSIGFLFEISPLSLLMISIAGALTLILTLVTAHVFYNLFGLQILSVPFIIVSTLVYLSASSFTNLYVISLYVPSYAFDLNIFPFWLSGYLKALGAIIFLPNEISGLFISLLLIYYSRILFVLSLAGFLLGIVLYGLFIGSIQSAAQDISSFNYILIAMALGGVFNIPSLKSYTVALLSVAIATLIASAGHVFWSQYGLPIFTLPFTLITLSFIYAFNILKFPMKTQVYKGSPEDNLDYYISNKNRFVTETTAISLPFLGRWHSWQGFDDQWTHQGLYKYAYDFVICDSLDHTYCNQGNLLTDYYCYGKEVTSPVNGRVIQVINHLPDNPIGSTDIINYWGNEVLIFDNRGFYIKIAHLATSSISVYEGQELSVGTPIGLCGNSGNSPQPHIHIQVQTSIFPTSPTIPFVFVNFEQENQYIPSGLPKVKCNITHCDFTLFYDQLTNFVLDDHYEYDVFFKDKKINTLRLKVKMSESLITYLESDKGKLYFGKQYGNFYIYSCEGNDPYLNLIFLALSTMPISYTEHLKWQDNINNSLVLNKGQHIISSFLNSFYTGWVTTHSHYHFLTETNIIGKVQNDFFDIHLDTSIVLDPKLKISEVQVGEYKLLQSTPSIKE